MKVAVLGMGGMGWGTAQLLKTLDGVDEVIGVDIREEQVRKIREKLKIHATTNVQEVLDDPQVRFVYIAASNDAHMPLAMAAFKANKAVLCEKPMATTLRDARIMVEEAERRKVFFQIGFELRYSKLYSIVKEWIDAGLLGTIVNTQCTYICSEFHGKGSWRNKTATGGSMFGEKLCHYVDLPRWWVGSPVTEVYSVCAPNVVPYYEVRDNYQTTYRFASGAVSHLTFVMYVGQTFMGDPLRNVIDQQKGDGHELRYLVIGTKGAAETDVFNRALKRWEFGDSPASMTSRLVEQRTWQAEEDGDYFHAGDIQMRDVARRVLNGLPPMTSARDSFESMQLVFATERSSDEGRVVRLSDLES